MAFLTDLGALKWKKLQFINVHKARIQIRKTLLITLLFLPLTSYIMILDVIWLQRLPVNSEQPGSRQQTSATCSEL
jgi:hypothetical protein